MSGFCPHGASCRHGVQPRPIDSKPPCHHLIRVRIAGSGHRYLENNGMTAIPDGAFTNLTALTQLYARLTLFRRHRAGGSGGAPPAQPHVTRARAVPLMVCSPASPRVNPRNAGTSTSTTSPRSQTGRSQVSRRCCGCEPLSSAVVHVACPNRKPRCMATCREAGNVITSDKCDMVLAAGSARCTGT